MNELTAHNGRLAKGGTDQWSHCYGEVKVILLGRSWWLCATTVSGQTLCLHKWLLYVYVNVVVGFSNNANNT